MKGASGKLALHNFSVIGVNVVNLATPIERKQNYDRANPRIEIGFRLHRQRVLDSYDRCTGVSG